MPHNKLAIRKNHSSSQAFLFMKLVFSPLKYSVHCKASYDNLTFTFTFMLVNSAKSTSLDIKLKAGEGG